MQEVYEEGFDVIFNYGYGCCAFAHNICGSQLVVPNEMPDTPKLVPPKFFINPRCPSGVVPTEVATIEASIGEASEPFFVAKVGLGNEPDSSAIVAGESEEPGVSGGN